MSAVNPLPPSGVSSDKRPYEPSMEEILASIRRIIADDQSLPNRPPMRDSEQGSFPTILKEPSRSIPPIERAASVDVVASVPQVRAEQPPLERGPDVTPVPVRDSAPVTSAPPLESGMAHGSIAAPQFAMPDRPVGGDVPQPQAPIRAPQAPVAAPPVETHAAEAAAHVPPPEEPVEDEPLYDTPIEPLLSRETPAERPQLFSAATDTAVSAAFNMLAASRLADNSDELMTLAREMIRPLLRTWIDDNLPSMVERMVRAEIERVARGGR